jgi:hypothetical protein
VVHVFLGLTQVLPITIYHVAMFDLQSMSLSAYAVFSGHFFTQTPDLNYDVVLPIG